MRRRRRGRSFRGRKFTRKVFKRRGSAGRRRRGGVRPLRIGYRM